MINCDIVKDMLPLYADGAVSSASESLIKKHLIKCSSCKKAYTLYKQSLRTGKTVELLPEENSYRYAGVVKKIRITKAAEYTVVLALVITAVSGIVSSIKNKNFLNREKK